MSTTHFSAAELANIVSVLEVRHYDNRAKLVKTMSEVATVNAFAYNTAYGENVPAVTAEEIDAEVRLNMATIDRAITTATMLCYNCDGFMNDRLRGDVGAICGQLARKAMEHATELSERVVNLQRSLSEADKEIAALKVKPARKPRAVKGA
jgi:hypothetical protein